jgi:RNA polymerase sigma factor (sigma-70 family)
VLAYIRRHGHDANGAEDLTQAFFARFVEQAFHLHADPQRGRFRAFLLTALKRFLIDSDTHDSRVKRGGRVQVRSMDSPTSSDDSLTNVTDNETPDSAFERAWARTIVESALIRLRAEAKSAGKAALFDQLSEFLRERPDDADYARVAEALNMRRNTLAVAVHRLRGRLRELVREQMADTAADDAELENEVKELGQSLQAALP